MAFRRSKFNGANRFVLESTDRVCHPHLSRYIYISIGRMCCLRTLKTILNTKRKPITSNCLFRMYLHHIYVYACAPFQDTPDVRIKNNFASKHSTWPDIPKKNTYRLPHLRTHIAEKGTENLDVMRRLFLPCSLTRSGPHILTRICIFWSEFLTFCLRKIAIWIRCGWCSKSKTNFLHFFFSLLCLSFAFGSLVWLRESWCMIERLRFVYMHIVVQKGFKRSWKLQIVYMEWEGWSKMQSKTKKNNGDIV